MPKYLRIKVSVDHRGIIDLYELEEFLEGHKCPDDILDPLLDWAATPALNKEDLAKWKLLCELKNEP